MRNVNLFITGFKKITLKRPSSSSTISSQDETDLLKYKRARPGPSFYSTLDQGSFIDDNLHDQSFIPDDNLHDQSFNPNDNLHEQESQSIKSPGEEDSNDWKDEIIYECVSLGIKCNGAMRLINKFILAKKLDDKFIGVETVRKRMSCLLTKRKVKKKNLQYLGFDGRKDCTLMPKNQTAKEEHMTFVDTDGYIAHKACSNKRGPTIASKVVEVLEENDSMDSVEIMATDGENANTGWKGKINIFIIYKLDYFNVSCNQITFF